MNLNFIQDSDKIHVETQNQIAYKQQIILKMKLLKQDFKDYTEINHGFVQINNVFSEIVKELYEHVTNFNKKQSQRIMMDMNADNIVSVNGQGEKKNCEKKKKKVSIPYGTMKKLQLLRQKMISCKIIIQNQNKFYRARNFNRQNQKISEVRFYKKVLQSYQNERQYFKKQTLDLQDRVQQIQAEVKKLSYNENHEFTDFDSKIISFESIMKYQKKMIAFKKLITELNLFTQLKTKINNELNIEKKKEDSKINGQKQQIKISYGSKFMKSSIDLQKKINLLKRQKIEILQHSYLKYKNSQYQTKALNQKLKKALLQYQARKYVLTLQNKIQNIKNHQQNLTNGKLQKITKTDYMIYLKEISSQLKEFFKSKEIVYRFKDIIHKNRKQERSKSVNLHQ